MHQHLCEQSYLEFQLVFKHTVQKSREAYCQEAMRGRQMEGMVLREAIPRSFEVQTEDGVLFVSGEQETHSSGVARTLIMPGHTCLGDGLPLLE
jgi:hypothetical protein